MSDDLSMHPNPPVTVYHKGIVYRTVPDRPTAEELEAERIRQEKCPHDCNMILCSSPPRCPLCHKVLTK